MTQNVPNVFPTYTDFVPYRIALIGEAPGADEVVSGTPFVGVSGRWLDYLLNRVGILRSACFLGNVCQTRPPGNDFNHFDWNGLEIQNGLTQLQSDLVSFAPHLCVCLGGQALRAAKGYPESITKWRGSLFEGANNTPFEHRKCLGTWHPASSLRVYEQTPLLLLDLKRARQQGERRELRLPQRSIRVLRTLGEVQLELNRIRENKRKIATDIEGYVNNLTCISFADDPLAGYVIPFAGPGGNFWTEEDELVVWSEVKALLEDPSVPKVLQNGLYDRFVLAYTYGILIRGITDDTMLKGWEAYCELQKALALQVSIYTLEPYYKDERTTDDWEEFWLYSGKDSCVTLEISNTQDTIPELRGRSRDHYTFNVAMQDPLLYMELRGLNYDSALARQEAARVNTEINSLQHSVNKVAGTALPTFATSLEELDYVSDIVCIKRRPRITRIVDLEPYCRSPYRPVLKQIEDLLTHVQLTDAQNGELSRLLEVHMNTDSPPQMQKFLYETLGFPVQLHRKTKKPTTDALSVIKLFKLAEREAAVAERKGDVVKQLEFTNKSAILKTILGLSSLLTQLQTLEVLCDADGRIRCAYNVVGTETGRLSCSKSPTRSGYNLQTTTKKQRFLFRPDPGYYLFQCDLSGADGWTVATHTKRLGDSTMWDDYVSGLRPAKIIARMYEGVKVSTLTRDQLKEECAKVDGDGWLYMASKRVQHGSNYDMKPLTMSNQILEDSWKYNQDIVYVSPSVCEELQILYFQRYTGVRVWHRWVKDQLKNSRSLTHASGHIRKFFGRPNDEATCRTAYSDEPQGNTTFSSKLAIKRIWDDPENHNPDGSLIIEPLHGVHDSVVGQFPIPLVVWALPKIREYHQNTLIIAGAPVIIPFEGAYGTSWASKDLTNPI